MQRHIDLAQRRKLVLHQEDELMAISDEFIDYVIDQLVRIIRGLLGLLLGLLGGLLGGIIRDY